MARRIRFVSLAKATSLRRGEHTVHASSTRSSNLLHREISRSPALSESHVRGLPANAQLWAMGPSVAWTFSTVLFDPVLSSALPSHWCVCLKLLSQLQPTKDTVSWALQGWHRAGMSLTSSWLLLAMPMQAEGTGRGTTSAEPPPSSLPGGPCWKGVPAGREAACPASESPASRGQPLLAGRLVTRRRQRLLRAVAALCCTVILRKTESLTPRQLDRPLEMGTYS